MTWINNITDSPHQGLVLKTIAGDLITFNLDYISSNKGWYYSLTYGSFSLSNRRIVVGVNLLRAFRNILPFGLACITTDGYEPIYLDDFKNGRASFYLLDSTDILTIESTFIA